MRKLAFVAYFTVIGSIAAFPARGALTVTETNGVDSLTLAFDAAEATRELWCAWDDADKDRKTGSYNPLLAIRGNDDYEETIHKILTMEIAECAMAFEKMPILQDANILRNILYSGVWTKYYKAKEEGNKGKE